ncbi:hypothetical protein BUE80_DR008580 [Diplocarpon rosae]|nr:hypothetical protein BUE80_DR008580 [Diplocarpon rosae]
MKKLKERSVDPEIENANRWEIDTNVGGSTVGGSTIMGSGDDFTAAGNHGSLISFLSVQTPAGFTPRVPPGYTIQARDQARHQTAGIPRSNSGGLGASTYRDTLASEASSTTVGLGDVYDSTYDAGIPRSTSGSFDPNAYGNPAVGIPRSSSGRLNANGYSNTSKAGVPRSTTGNLNPRAARTSHTSPGKGYPRFTNNPHNVGRQSRNGAESGEDSSCTVDIITDRHAARSKSFTGRSSENSRASTDRSCTTSTNPAKKWAKSSDLVTARKAVSRVATAFTEQDLPPSPLAMKTIVRPREFGPAPNKFAKYLELAGESLSEEEQEDWKEKRAEMVADGRARFEQILVGNMMKIEPLKGWMRMRVHLGTVVLTAYFKGFAASKVSFEKFVEMVTHPRQTGGFDKRYVNNKPDGVADLPANASRLPDALTAMRLRDKILRSSNIFAPVHGRTKSLHEVEFKNTEIIFVETSGGEQLRLEAEIDKSWEDDVSSYQTGAIRLFRFKDKKGKSKLIEMTTIDIERGIDCKLEVIADDEITNIPSEFYQLIRRSITAKSRVCVDKLGLEYPQVNPYSTSELRITGVVVKSVIQYKIVDSGHVVEIALYREWSGTATKEVPSMEASVSLFHPDWDEWMESIENTTRSRKFGDRLCNLFHDGTPGQGSMQTFFEKMTMVQGLLVDAKKEREFQAIQAALAAGEAGGERI